MKDKIKIIFMGTPEIAVPTLEKLNEEYTIAAVVTVPDKPKGRGLKLLPSQVKEKAQQLGLNILQPDSLKDPDFINAVKNIEPDIIVVFAFRILPPEVYNLAKIAAFNIHTSLLPKYRGAAPINWAIISGEKISGITSFILNDKVDTGSILLQKSVNIPENCTAGELYDLLMALAPQLAIDTCEMLISENYHLLPQNDAEATIAPKLFKQTAKINWTQNAESIKNFINGYSPTPCAWTSWEQTQLKIFHAKIFTINNDEILTVNGNTNDDIGKYLNLPGDFYIKENKLLVKTGSGTIEILELQLEGKKKIKITDFINGYRGNNYGQFN